MRGMFITFEGPDKAGKSTQIRLLCQYYEQNGIPYLLTREPGGCAVSEKIRQLLLDPSNDMGPVCEAMLYAAARSELSARCLNLRLNRAPLSSVTALWTVPLPTKDMDANWVQKKLHS